MLKEGSANINLAKSDSIVIIVDASQSAQEYWEEILNITLPLLENLPADVERQLYFLSNAKKYNWSRLSYESKVWQKENILRGSFITPIFEKILEEDISKILVIGSGKIFDLEDWQESRLIDKLILINMGESSLQGEESFTQELRKPVPSDLLSILHSPIYEVEIKGEGFMPYFWDNAGYKLMLEEGKAILKGSELEDFSLSIAFFGERVKAKIVRTDGSEEISVEYSDIEIMEQEWMPLTMVEEGKVFQDAINNKNINCPICKKEHKPQTLICTSGEGILGRCVYPSLEDKTGFVIFKELPEGIVFKHHHVKVIRVKEGLVAIATGTKADIYEYTKKKWIKKERIKQYYLLEDNEYLVVI
ncbi:MAG: hypothetical protein ACE5KT_04320 [Methanosarcinales archaeon]